MKIQRWLVTTCLTTALLFGQTAGFAVQARDLGVQMAQSEKSEDRDWRGRGGGKPDRKDDRGRGQGRDRGDRDDDRSRAQGRDGDRDRDRDRGRDRDHRADRRDNDRRDNDRDWRRDRRDHDGRRDRFEPRHRRHVYQAPPHRVRHYRNIVVVRPHGHWYHGYGRHRSDDSAYKWLAFTAITLGILNVLSEAQQRAYEDAQIRATAAPIGEPIYWERNGAEGTVTALRDGYTNSGRYCREFQQTVVIGGRSERAYGTACQQPDGAWEIVDSGG